MNMKHAKKTLCLLAAFSLMLSLAACSGGAKAAFDPETATAAILDSGAFSAAPEELDAANLYDFEGYGLKEGVVTASKSYLASGLTEQVSVLVCKDESGAKAVEQLLKLYLEDAKASYQDYAPNEIPKLDAAILERRGSTVLLVVAGDAAKAQTAVDSLG